MDIQAAVYAPLPEKSKKPLAYKILLVLAMMSLMAGSLTGVMTYFTIGYTETFFTDWLSSFLFAAVTVMPAGFLIMAMLTGIAAKLLPEVAQQKRNLAIGVSMAFIMESLMALTTAYNNVGFNESVTFFNAWFDGLVGALPVALALMVTISMTVKPKVEAYLKG